MKQTSFPGRKPLPTGETALRQKRGGLAWVSILLVLCLVAGMVPVFSQQTQVSAQATYPGSHVLNTVTNMEGVTVNLFDYWVANDRDSTWGNVSGGNTNINKDHVLQFGSADSTSDYFNQWEVTEYNGYSNRTTRTGDIKQGIVQNTLDVNGYPVLNPENNVSTSEESLAYLFDPSMENVAGRESYLNATGLFQIEDGYYSYNSKKNYAEYKEDEGRFYVYDTYGVVGTDAIVDNSAGHFFPFDAANEVFTENWNGNLSRRTNVTAQSNELNHLFGFTLEAEFLQPQNGQVTIGGRPQDMTFEFAGDDDVWVFIDGVLVMDLGGKHNSASGTINFSTGEIQITTQYSSKTEELRRGEWVQTDSESLHEDSETYTTSLSECFKEANKYNDVSWSENGETFADNTYHTLSFFYLERGANASNMTLKFNLDTRPVNQILKMDEKGEPISGITYNLYEATVAEDGTYTKKENADVLATLTTDRDGYATFLEEDDTPFEFNSEEYQPDEDEQYHFILEEANVPSGYRSTGDIWLRFDPKTSSGGQLLVSNQWQTGAMANYSFVGTEVKLDWEGGEYAQPSGDRTVDNILDNGGTMFAVVLMKDETDQSGNTWVPLYGNNKDGWEIESLADHNNNVISAVIEAARQQNQNNDVVICEKNQQDQWEVTLNQLPGDITQYYYADTGTPQNAKYIVTFYASSAGSLETADASNTWLVSTSSFEREFSANIWIPNIRNMFQVQKLDASGNPINSGTVSYALYESEPTWNSETNQWETSEGQALTPYDTVTNLSLAKTEGQKNPVAVFGLDGNSTGTKPLVTGETYYLVETAAPAGYVPSTQVVKIVVDDTGVHADAGTTGDAVTVAVGVGYLLKPMEKFGANDAIDATLHDITGVVQTGMLNESGNSIDWSSNKNETQTIHLNYDPDGALLQYSLTQGEDVNTGITQPYLTYESGFGRLYIDQCLDHNKGTFKTEIEEAINNNEYYGKNGITPLFTGSTTVQIKNDLEIKTGSVTVSKTVTGLLNPDADTFNFTIQFTAGDKAAVPGTVNYTTTAGNAVVTDGTDGTVTVGSNNSIAFTLKNGGSVTFTDLPEGLQYTITETTTGYKYQYSTTVTDTDTDPNVDAIGTSFTNTIAENDTITVTYTNAVALVDFDFTKVKGNSEDNTPLDGAGFTLYQWNGTGDNTDLVNTENPGENWEEVNGGAVSGSNGVFNFDGLYCDATYRLVETTTPGGYVAPGGQWQLTYVGEDEENSYNGWAITLVTADGSTAQTPAFKVVDNKLYLPNYQVPEIPVTGGEGGGWMFYGLAGTLLVGGAVLTLFAFSRRRKQF